MFKNNLVTFLILFLYIPENEVITVHVGREKVCMRVERSPAKDALRWFPLTNFCKWFERITGGGFTTSCSKGKPRPFPSVE